MKIAIIGSGLAGMSCAIELERNGIMPSLFEKKSFIGDALELNICMFNSTKKDYRDPLIYIKKMYGINLNPISNLNEVVINISSSKRIMKGNFGYILKRGRAEFSLDDQIANILKSSINFNEYISIADIKELSNNFDKIVIASGNHNISKALYNWKPFLNTKIRIATIIGEFQTGLLEIWFDERFAKKCYGYMIASSPKQALLTLVVDNVSYSEMDFYWKKFLSSTQNDYKMIETKDCDYCTGSTIFDRLDNIYFIGNAGGFTEDFLAYGSIGAIESGILAARSIINNIDYSVSIKPLKENVEQYFFNRNKIGIIDYEENNNKKLISIVSGLNSQYNSK